MSSNISVPEGTAQKTIDDMTALGYTVVVVKSEPVVKPKPKPKPKAKVKLVKPTKVVNLDRNTANKAKMPKKTASSKKQAKTIRSIRTPGR
jgi:hypothetical protein